MAGCIHSVLTDFRSQDLSLVRDLGGAAVTAGDGRVLQPGDAAQPDPGLGEAADIENAR